MKKLLYFIPLVLIGLSALPFSLYKDNVDFLLAKNPNAKIEDLQTAVTTLSPSHWKMLGYQTQASASLGTVSFSFDSSDTEATTTQQTPEVSKPDPLYKDATFRGFPFGAYFSNSNSTKTATSQSSYSASGYSWLWATVDALLVVVSLVIAFKFNRTKKGQPVAVQPLTQPLAQPYTQPIANPSMMPSDQPQVTITQPNVVSPTQPLEAQPPLPAQPYQQPQPSEYRQDQPQ